MFTTIHHLFFQRIYPEGRGRRFRRNIRGKRKIHLDVLDRNHWHEELNYNSSQIFMGQL